MSARLVTSFFVACLALAGCGGTSSTPDTGMSTGSDAGRDSGSAMTSDAGSDAGGSASDTGPAVDTGATADTGAAADTGAMLCAATYAGCTTPEDHTADTSPVVVTISGFTYTPSCIHIHTGQMVTLPGASIHPLTNSSCSPAGSPIPMGSTTGGTFTFTTAGNYGYHCSVHGSDLGTGMSGLIIVD